MKTRREFLTSATLAGGLLSVSQASTQSVLAADNARGLDALTDHLNHQKPAFMAFVGDLNHSQSADLAERNASMQTLMRATAERAAFPCHYGMGNTDMGPGDDPCLVFRNWFKSKPYYSFNRGGVHFVMLYTEKDKPDRYGTVDDGQLQWLARDLRALRQGTPVVLFGHHALYDWAGKWEKDNWGIDNSQELLAVLAPYHLIATFSGHRHLNRLSLDKRRVLHVINGAMVGDHSDDIGPKQDGIGYRWVSIAAGTISTTWMRVGSSPITPA